MYHLFNQTPNTLGITFDPKLTFSQYINLTIIKAKQTFNIRKALTLNKWSKQNELITSTFKANICPYWNTQTPYGALPYQTLTSRNCKPYRTQLCLLLLAAHKYLRPVRQNQCPTNGQLGTHLKLHATHLKQMTQTQTHFLHYLNVRLDLRINKFTFKCKKIYCWKLEPAKILMAPAPQPRLQLGIVSKFIRNALQSQATWLGG